jgi:hypothetical protein
LNSLKESREGKPRFNIVVGVWSFLPSIELKMRLHQ